ncbi:DUF882 domain-containing protein [uncultured Desulfosarcina sp.]|uniref:YcbK family protein n=1 Tax=uncultured Desulfosarcina sp. TaxID=218289 RepID=UPI0029C725E7|nr:DUF882 domain-containing protein [uncultured Desulfosarcina sp.]
MFFRTLILTSIILELAAVPVPAKSSMTTRFFHSGNGVIRLVSEKNGKAFSGRFRLADGQYRTDAVRAIAAVFGAPDDPSRQVISLRLIEFLDYLEDRLNPGAQLTITSGYRAPEYNTRLRKRGGLAAKASLHQYGMAVDLVMQGVPSKRVWETVKTIGFGGTGYYHGRAVHLDVGPARSWDEKTSGVGLGLSDDNKLIGLVTDYDVYHPGDTVVLSFIRMTAFPIGVRSEFRLIRKNPSEDAGETVAVDIDGGVSADGSCTEFHDIDQMAGFRWPLPPDLQPGRYRICADFCGTRWEKMPASILTPEFDVRRP